MHASTPQEQEQPLAISPQTVCFIVSKLREYEASELLVDADEAATDEPPVMDCADFDSYTEHENDYRNEPVRQELESLVNDLPEDQQIDLVALMWLGRNNADADEWPAIREEAAQAHNARTALYLLGTPLACDFLQDGLSTLGFSCEESSPEAPDTSWSTP